MHFPVLKRTFMPALLVGVQLLAGSLHAEEKWSDISTSLLTKLTNQVVKADWPGGCSGVVVNRLNGHLVIKVVGLGLWRSTDQGVTWERVDGKTVSGRDERGSKRSPAHGQLLTGRPGRLDGGWSAVAELRQQWSQLGLRIGRLVGAGAEDNSGGEA